MSLVLVLALLTLQEERREILCLYDSTENRSDQLCEIHLYAETALNYLGLIPVYRDVNEALPGEDVMQRYRGVLTWFVDSRLKNSRAYWAWMARQALAGRKVVILGNLGATYEVPPEFINEGLRPLGLTYHGRETENSSVIEILKKDPIVEFERPLDQELRWYVHITSDSRNQVYLRARRKDIPESDSDLVVLGPWGGFAWVTIHYDPRVYRDQWWLDPYAFLAKAFDVERMPKLDFTTAMGRRIFFASIDGDGLANGAQPGPNAGRLAGEIIRDDYLRGLDLPVTASAIAADLDRHAALAKSIFDLPNVEVGAHGWLHPTNWHKKILSYPGEFSLEKEVQGAVRRVNEVAAPKKVKVYQWTGDCDPNEEAVAMTERLGLMNINGSDPGRWQNYASLAIRPPTIWNGGFLQFNGRSMSENHFTDLWTRNFFAFQNAICAYERTGAPRRITPIHLYFHYYVVEQPSGEMALRHIIEWIRKQRIYPVAVSEYQHWFRGFLSGRIEARGERSWRFRNYGQCRTVRFDDTPEVVDFARSPNVLGYCREGTTLYVHLGKGDEAAITLQTGDDPKTFFIMDANGDWDDGWIRAKTAADAVFMTPSGPLHQSSTSHDLKVELR